MTKEYVYVVVNPRLMDTCKVGKTNDVNRRLRELNGESGNPGDLVHYGYVPVDDMDEVERDFHDMYRHNRLVNNYTGRSNEWFRMNPREALEYLVEYCSQPDYAGIQYHIIPAFRDAA